MNGQFLLTLCYNVSFEYCLFKGAFLSFAKSDESPEDLKQAERLLEMYGAQDNVQDIEFRIWDTMVDLIRYTPSSRSSPCFCLRWRTS